MGWQTLAACRPIGLWRWKHRWGILIFTIFDIITILTSNCKLIAIVNCSPYGVTCLACTAVLTVLKYNLHHFQHVFLCHHHSKDVLTVLIVIKSSSLSPFLKSTHSKIITIFIRPLHSKTKYSL